MHRLDRDTLFISILNTIQCSRLKRHRSGRQIVHSLESHEGQQQLAGLLCERLDNDSTMVIRAEFVTREQRPGRWGVDEPVPATVPEPPKPPRNGTA